MQKRGRQIRLFYVDGQHNGIVRAELMNWTGYVYAAPRASLKQLLEKEDAYGSGIYFLISKSQELEGRYSVYVGETVNGIQRMQHHDYNTEPYRVCRRVNILRDYPDDKTKLYPRN
ncbi:GIY-YIG nuclease family protein [Acinetobacter haemolyticus]|uniref:hypothetical protein n=1 Tax=Acinetobacter haemolyticus TaxID=29430 RepID=UPI0002E3C8E1|nr:hypothetical protein [Acinetobacter haemolyticus]